MNNTVVLTGKGYASYVLFVELLNRYQDAKLTTVKPKWWQSDHRYQLRLQNLDADEIVAMQLINGYYPFTSKIHIDVF